MSLFGKTPEPAAPSPPRTQPECTCGSTSFAPGGPVVTPWHDGTSAGVEITGGVLSCLRCGARWFTSPKGLHTPHRDAMPPAWAMADMQREHAEKRAQQLEDAKEAARTNGHRQRPASQRLSQPPRNV